MKSLGTGKSNLPALWLLVSIPHHQDSKIHSSFQKNVIKTKKLKKTQSLPTKNTHVFSLFLMSVSPFAFRETMPIHIFAAQLRGPWKWPSPGPWMDLGPHESMSLKSIFYKISKSMFMQILLVGNFHENMVQKEVFCMKIFGTDHNSCDQI